MRRDRLLAHTAQVSVLKPALEGGPVLPGALDARAVDVRELVGVVALAVRVPAQPFDDLFRAVRVREPGEKARAVEIRIGADLEVDARAARLEPERVVERRAVAHHGAEHHLVEAALRPPEPARHPRLEEARRALGLPARHGEARHGEIAVEQRLRMRLLRKDLAGEALAPA